MTLVVAECSTAPEHAEELMTALQALAEASLTELGCVTYDVYRSVENPERFVSIETYLDAAAFEAHQSAEHFVSIGANREIPLLKTRNVRILPDPANAE